MAWDQINGMRSYKWPVAASSSGLYKNYYFSKPFIRSKTQINEENKWSVTLLECRGSRIIKYFIWNPGLKVVESAS